MGYFKNYAAGRPATVLPFNGTEKVLMLQNGIMTLVSPTSIAALTPTMVDTSAGAAAFSLPASGSVRYIKTDDSGNAATLVPSIVGQTIMRQASLDLTVQDEAITLQLVGSNWYRVG